MHKIQVEVVIESSVQKAWEFWNTPELIKLWAFASDEWECPHAENDLVVGGKFTTRMSAKDKSFSFDLTGTYTDIEQYKKITYVMSEDANNTEARTCEITFSDIGDGKVKVTESFDPENENSEELQRNGWQSILNNFKKAVEAVR
jgi:uncharacterized protein YndB with AHSA1/START domain